MKWALVLAGVSDFARPAEKLSLTQNAALTSTGLIWTRWCLIIKPKNYLYVFFFFLSSPSLVSGGRSWRLTHCVSDVSLAAVNFFLGIVGVVQCSRIIMWQQSQKGLPEKLEEAKEAVVKS